jgi:hypothetical protein
MTPSGHKQAAFAAMHGRDLLYSASSLGLGHRDETARVHHADCHTMNHEEMGMMQAVEVYKD